MESQSNSLQSIMLKYGAFLSAISIIYSLMLFFLDLHYGQEMATGLLSIAITIAFIVIGIYAHKKENDGFLSLSEALKIGLGIAMISAIAGILYSAFLIKVLDPNVLEVGLEFQRDRLLDDPELSVQQVDAYINQQKQFSGLGYLSVGILIMSLVIGFATSLISGLILKKSRPE